MHVLHTTGRARRARSTHQGSRRSRMRGNCEPPCFVWGHRRQHPRADKMASSRHRKLLAAPKAFEHRAKAGAYCAAFPASNHPINSEIVDPLHVAITPLHTDSHWPQRGARLERTFARTFSDYACGARTESTGCWKQTSSSTCRERTSTSRTHLWPCFAQISQLEMEGRAFHTRNGRV